MQIPRVPLSPSGSGQRRHRAFFCWPQTWRVGSTSLLGANHRDVAAQTTMPADAPSGTVEQVYSTDEGPVTITTRGKLVMVTESFDLGMARKLTQMILDAQGTGDLKQARLTPPDLTQPVTKRPVMTPPVATPPVMTSSAGMPTLSGGLVRLFAQSGVMKSAVQAGIRAAAQ